MPVESTGMVAGSLQALNLLSGSVSSRMERIHDEGYTLKDAHG